MTTSEDPRNETTRYIPVEGVEYTRISACTHAFEKPLLGSRRLAIRQTLLLGVGAAEELGSSAAKRVAYALEGSAEVSRQGAPAAVIRKGHVVVIPAGTSWGPQLRLTSERLVFLEVAELPEAGAQASSMNELQVVAPEDVPSYEPAGHTKTRNRCLYADEHMEVISGLIEVGGGAERHSHPDHEQCLYVINGPGGPLFIHYPPGAPHGTGGGMAQALDLVVIYAPPLGEAHAALAPAANGERP